MTPVTIESVPDILERELPAVIQDWLSRVEKESDLTCIPLTYEERTGHLPQLRKRSFLAVLKSRGASC
jgi:hypothetical protein